MLDSDTREKQIRTMIYKALWREDRKVTPSQVTVTTCENLLRCEEEMRRDEFVCIELTGEAVKWGSQLCTTLKVAFPDMIVMQREGKNLIEIHRYPWMLDARMNGQMRRQFSDMFRYRDDGFSR